MIHNKYSIISLLVCSVSFFSCGKEYPNLSVVEDVDLNRYSGKWYEVARLPNRFQKNCLCSIAEYSIIDSLTIRVVNKCKLENGEVKSVKGKAFVVSKGKLKVQFFFPFRGDYWILDLDRENYTYAIIGTPDRKYFWILSRNPNLSDEKIEQLLSFLKSNQFDTSNVIISNKNCIDSNL